MSDSSKTVNQLGQSGFYHFFGTVEDRNDPEMLGRLRVRIFDMHSSNTQNVPTNHLPWCQVVLPVTVNDSAMVDLQLGTIVFGFYMDGEDMQVPVITGHLPGKLAKPNYRTYADKTLNGYADGRNRRKRITISGGKVTEPADPYAGKYPTVHGFMSETGHIFEYDDTPGQERICITHRTGTYIQIDKEGNLVMRQKKSHILSDDDNFELCKNKTVHIKANLDIMVEGNSNIVVKGNSTIKVGGNCTETISGTKTIKASGNLILQGAKVLIN